MSSSGTDFEDAAAVSVILAATVIIQRKTKKIKRDRKWLGRREEGKGILHMLNDELLTEDPNSYTNYLRMSGDTFQTLLAAVENKISKMDTFMRDSVSVKHRQKRYTDFYYILLFSRLQITLRFLATGESYRSLMYSTRVHESTISRFIPEVCTAIYDSLKDTYLKMPTSQEEWERIADDFYAKWDFPNCLGALDGKHIRFRSPHSSGSYYYNYKGNHSIVLLGLVNANYRFIYVNVGVNGRVIDGGVFRDSYLSKAIAENSVCFPKNKALPGRTFKVPYVIIADDAFPLSERIMKPYSARDLNHDCQIYNYRLSRARRIIESAFGILANRFRILLNTINLDVKKVEIITLCCITLHNFLTNVNSSYDENITENVLIQVTDRQAGNKSSTSARIVRDEFREFFVTTGKRDWQDQQVTCHNM